MAAGPKKNYTSSRAALANVEKKQKNSRAIGWLYAAIEKYTTKTNQDRVRSIQNIQYCLEEIMTTRSHNYSSDLTLFEGIATFLFQKSPPRRDSPFVHACLLGKTELVEYFLSLYIVLMVGVQRTSIKEQEHISFNSFFSPNMSLIYWLSWTTMFIGISNSNFRFSHFFKEFNHIFFSNDNDTAIIWAHAVANCDKRQLSGLQIIEIVESFLIVRHPTRNNRINSIIMSHIESTLKEDAATSPVVLANTTAGRKTKKANKDSNNKKKKKKKKRLPTINCRDSLDLDLEDDDAYYSDDYYSSYDSDDDESHDDHPQDSYNETGGTSSTTTRSTSRTWSSSASGEEEVRDSNQVTTTEEQKESNNEFGNGHDEDTFSFLWEDTYELDSLSDEEPSEEDAITFNSTSFATDLESGLYEDVTRSDDAGDDWDAIPEVQSVISVDTFSGEKQIFSYKDALFVNKEEPKTILSTKVVETRMFMTHKSKVNKSTVEERDESDESDLFGVYFDHDSAKLKGGKRRTIRELKGN